MMLLLIMNVHRFTSIHLCALSFDFQLLFVCVGEPDMPELSADEGKIERNSYSVPIKQLNDGGSPIKHYIVRYRKVGVKLNDPNL